ncbi:MAG: T9SS C-terminal target domain-containing protein [Candidatus Zixiibacteriota bacterium]|nr:MAG: T9SS C-terminal target domain-containing protein [candidate division Zixibacteria bacterium]
MKSLTLLTLCALLWAAPAAATWPTTVEENLMFVPNPDTLGLKPTTLAYSDNRTLVVYQKQWYGLFGQIIDRFGNFQFPEGQPLTPANQSFYLENPSALADQTGGALVCWKTFSPNPMPGVVAQHLDSSGNRLWGDSGRVVFSLNSNTWDACPDSQGGFLLAVSYSEPALDWLDLRAQKVNPDGSLPWGPDGVVVSGTPDHDASVPKICPDGEGGCFLVWRDSRTQPSSLYMQHLNAQGQPQWSQDLYVCINPVFHQLIADGAGGAILQANPGQTTYNKHYRISPSGQILWVRDHLSWFDLSEMVLGEPGYFYLGFFFWDTIYAQRVDLNGNPTWPSWPGSYGATVFGLHGWTLGGGMCYCYQAPYFYALFRESPVGALDNLHLITQYLDGVTGQRMLGDSGAVLTVRDCDNFSYLGLRPDDEGGITAVFVVDSVNDHEAQAKRCNADGTLGGPFPLGVTLTPQGGPIVIPPGGGSFTYGLAVVDTDTVGGRIDLWIEALLPTGDTLEIAHREDLVLPAGGTLARTGLVQAVPGAAPPGTYGYTLYAGNYPCRSPWGQGGFTFEKAGAEGWGPGAGEGWKLSGDLFGAETAENDFILHPSSFILSVSPNPFNPVAVIRFELPAAGYVRLEVFDVCGRPQGSPLREGWQTAGTHEVRFDGTGLPSGVYLVRLEAGGASQVQKMVLLK